MRSCERRGESVLPSIEDILTKNGICNEEEVQKEYISCSCCISAALKYTARFTVGDLQRDAG